MTQKKKSIIARREKGARLLLNPIYLAIRVWG
jgi:hypothetical protein